MYVYVIANIFRKLGSPLNRVKPPWDQSDPIKRSRLYIVFANIFRQRCPPSSITFIRISLVTY